MGLRPNRLAIIAGGGVVPLKTLRVAQERGIRAELVALQGFADAETRAEAGLTAALGEVGKVLKFLKEKQVDSLIMVGMVARPDFSSLRTDWKGVKLLPRVIAAAARGDDALLRELALVFEQEGIRVIGVDDIADGMLAREGVLTGESLIGPHRGDVARAVEIARHIGAADIGQGAVVARGLVLAVEAQEGTDAMLGRVAMLPENLRGSPQNRCGVLAKMRKPIQDGRLDLPTLGTRTVEGAARAGLAGIVIEAGGTLIVDEEAVVNAADTAGIFVLAHRIEGDAP